MASTNDYSKNSYYKIPPTDLIRVTDKADPLYDPRVHEPADMALVASIDKWGVRKPLKVVRRKDGPAIVDGRRRHAAILFIYQRQAKAKMPLSERITAPCIFEAVPADATIGVILDNLDGAAGAKILTPLQKAHQAAHLRRHGKTDAEIAELFTVEPTTVANWIDMLSAEPATLEALAKGETTARAAIQEGKEAQGKSASAEAKTAKAKTANGKTRKPGERTQMSVAQLRTLHSALTVEDLQKDQEAQYVAQVLATLLGTAPWPHKAGAMATALAKLTAK